LRIVLVTGNNSISELALEVITQAVKAVELATGEKIHLHVVRDEDVFYPILKVNGLSPIVMRDVPKISVLVKTLMAHIEISKLMNVNSSKTMGVKADVNGA